MGKNNFIRAGKIMNLQELLDESARAAFNMTRGEAQKKGICISCKKNFIARSELEEKEYVQSALCGICFDKIASEE